MNYQKNNNSYFNPVTIIKSNSWVQKTKQILKENKRTKPLIITSSGTNKRLNINNYFDSNSIINNVTANPTIQYCDLELKNIYNQDYDSIIAIGGGSVMDAAKVFLAGLNINDKSTLELINNKKNIENNITSIFIPTTHGTGSEVTMWGTIWDMENELK